MGSKIPEILQMSFMYVRVRYLIEWLFLNCSSVITVSSRSCSGAPSISEARCSGHVVNALRTEICLCGTNGCNGLHNHEMNVEGRNLVHYSGQGHFNPIKRGMFVGMFVVIKFVLWFTRYVCNTRFSFRSKQICALIHSSGKEFRSDSASIYLRAAKA